MQPTPEQAALRAALDDEVDRSDKVGDGSCSQSCSTEPNAVVQPVHEQAMPVLLMTAEDVDRWLNGNSVEDALAIQKLAADDEVGPPVKPEKKAA